MEKDSTCSVRITAKEKEAFVLASKISGISLSKWIRERLRLVARRELEDNGRDIPFMPTDATHE